MSHAQRAALGYVADMLAHIARDLLRPRPSDQTSEASDARLSQRLADLAALLRAAQS